MEKIFLQTDEKHLGQTAPAVIFKWQNDGIVRRDERRLFDSLDDILMEEIKCFTVGEEV